MIGKAILTHGMTALVCVCTAPVVVPKAHRAIHHWRHRHDAPPPAPKPHRQRAVRMVIVDNGPCVPMALPTAPLDVTTGPGEIDLVPVDLSLPRVPYAPPPPGLLVVPPLPPASPVPEPASWMAWIAGFGIVGGILRRRKRATA